VVLDLPVAVVIPLDFVEVGDVAAIHQLRPGPAARAMDCGAMARRVPKCFAGTGARGYRVISYLSAGSERSRKKGVGMMRGRDGRKARSTACRLLGGLMVLVLLLPREAGAREGDEANVEPSAPEMCELIETHAELRGLSPDFLARLIWQESRFNRLAVSPKGAQGIAQFMPATAAERGLEDPFDIATSIAESAAFLGELRSSLGNLGLAAAGYNAGPERVRRWLGGEAGLPRETRHFVQTITGLPAEDWQEADMETAEFTLDEERPFREACELLVTAGLLRLPGDGIHEGPGGLPWGVQVAAHFSRDVAIAVFERLRQEFSSVLADQEPMVVNHRVPGRGSKPLHAVRIGAETRDEAEALCQELRALDGPCMVMPN
jgi:hypothetical protein